MQLATLDLTGQSKALGKDLARGESGDLALVHGGLALQSGEAVAVADIVERLQTERGSEFYDRTFGEILDTWVEEEDTETNRLQMLLELKVAIGADPRVTSRSAEAEIVEWTNEPRYLKVRAGWIWITGEVMANLVLEADADGVRVVQSYKPTTAATEVE